MVNRKFFLSSIKKIKRTFMIGFNIGYISINRKNFLFKKFFIK